MFSFNCDLPLGGSALIRAAYWGHADTVRVLMEAGADAGKKTQVGAVTAWLCMCAVVSSLGFKWPYKCAGCGLWMYAVRFVCGQTKVLLLARPIGACSSRPIGACSSRPIGACSSRRSRAMKHNPHAQCFSSLTAPCSVARQPMTSPWLVTTLHVLHCWKSNSCVCCNHTPVTLHMSVLKQHLPGFANSWQDEPDIVLACMAVCTSVAALRWTMRWCSANLFGCGMVCLMPPSA